MKALKLIAFIGATSLLFMGCPYETKIPLDDPTKTKPDQGLVGKWVTNSDDEKDYEYHVKIDDNLYSIEKVDLKNGGDPTKYKGFISTVGGQTFLSIYEESTYATDSVSYYIYRMIKKSNDRVILDGVTDNITETFTSAADLRAFIQKNMNLSFFYNKDDHKALYRND